MATSRDPREFTMSFGDHLDELRRRLIWAFVGPLPIFIVCLIFGGPLLQFLVAPVQQQLHAAGLPATLIVTSPIEPFAAYLKVATVVAALIAAPWILFQIWLFVAPGLYTYERRFAYFLFPMSAVLTAVAAVFLYTVMLPVSMAFLIGFGANLLHRDVVTAPLPPGVALPQIAILEADPVDPTPGDEWVNLHLRERRIALPEGDGVRVYSTPLTAGGVLAQLYTLERYTNLVFTLGLVFAVAFQLPVVLLLANWLHLVQVEWLRKQRRYAFFIIAVISAVATPADPMSMLFLMLPLIALYELSIVLMRIVPATRVAGEPKEPADAGEA